MVSWANTPAGWLDCNGQSLPIAQNQALFALLGTRFGGDGKTNFNLPDLRGRIPVGRGRSAESLTYSVGNAGGAENVVLTAATVPSHTHQLFASPATPAKTSDNGNPTGNLTGTGATASPPFPNNVQGFYSPGGAQASFVPMAASAVSTAGASAGHANCMPTAVVRFVIATQGLFPPHQY